MLLRLTLLLARLNSTLPERDATDYCEGTKPTTSERTNTRPRNDDEESTFNNHRRCFCWLRLLKLKQQQQRIRQEEKNSQTNNSSRSVSSSIASTSGLERKPALNSVKKPTLPRATDRETRQAQDQRRSRGPINSQSR